MASPDRFRDETVAGRDGLVLRRLELRDAGPMVKACNDPVTQQWLPLPRPYTEQNALHFITRRSPEERSSGLGLVRAIEQDGEFAGVIDLKNVSWQARTAEIGYWVHPAFRGRGIAGRAAHLLATWAMAENGFQRVEIRVATGNTASLRSAVARGFVVEGVLRNAGYTHSGRVDLTVASLVRDDIDWPRGEPVHP